MGLIFGGGTKIPHTVQRGQKIKKKKKRERERMEVEWSESGKSGSPGSGPRGQFFPFPGRQVSRRETARGQRDKVATLGWEYE